MLTLQDQPTEDQQRQRLEMISRFQTTPAAAPGPIPFALFSDELLGLYRPPLRAKATYIKIRQVLGIVADLLGPAGTTADFTPALIVAFIASRPPAESPNSTISLLNSLRAAFSFAFGQGYCRVNAFSLRKTWLRSSPPNRERRRHHSAAEIAAVLEVMRLDIVRKVPGSWSQWRARRLYALASTVAYCGLRRNEALRLRVEDLDVPGRMLVVVERQGSRLKTIDSAAPVPIPDRLAAVLAEWLPYLALSDRPAENPSGPLPASNPKGERDQNWVFPNVYQSGPWIGGSPGHKPLDRMKAAGERAGVSNFTFLSLRHSWATMAESRWGLSAPTIQRVLRHSNVRTQAIYRHADPQNLRAACATIGFGNEPTAAPAAVPAIAIPEPFVYAPAPPRPPAAPRRRRPNNGPKLTDADVAEMRELRARGWTYTALLLRYPVAKSTLHAALWGLTFRHVPQFGEGMRPIVRGV
jgi:integrase